jgi:hypothetical protein
VVDVDPKDGGDVGLQFLSVIGEMPETRRTLTAGGGFHLMYALEPSVRVGNSTKKIGMGVDVKSADAYVVLPGSTIRGKAYKWASDRAPVPAPEWLIEECGRADDRPPNAGKRLVEEDDWARDRSWRYLVDDAGESSEGRRNVDCVRYANRCFDFALDIDSSVAYMLEWNRGKCFPAMDAEEVERTVKSTAKSRKKPFGCDHPLAPGFEPYEMPSSKTGTIPPALPEPPEEPKPPKPTFPAARAYIDDAAPDESDIPDRDTAAVVVAGDLRQFMPLSGLQIATLMRDWSVAGYGLDLDDAALFRAIAEMERRETSARWWRSPRRTIPRLLLYRLPPHRHRRRAARRVPACRPRCHLFPPRPRPSHPRRWRKHSPRRQPQRPLRRDGGNRQTFGRTFRRRRSCLWTRCPT